MAGLGEAPAARAGSSGPRPPRRALPRAGVAALNASAHEWRRGGGGRGSGGGVGGGGDMRLVLPLPPPPHSQSPSRSRPRARPRGAPPPCSYSAPVCAPRAPSAATGCAFIPPTRGTTAGAGTCVVFFLFFSVPAGDGGGGRLWD